MSWPGENGPPTSGGAGGRGRRRRTDSPPEDPYEAPQGQGASGRHGSGEYERPAEYVAQAEQEAAAYDQYNGYADPAYYQGGAYQQQPQDPYYGQGYAQPEQYQSQDSYQPQDQYQSPDPYQGQSYGYGNAGYPEAPAQYRNLDSSGFYQPTQQPSQQPAYQEPQQPAYQEPQQPSYEYDPYSGGQAQQPAAYEPFPQQPSYQEPTGYIEQGPYVEQDPYAEPAAPRISAFPNMPEPVAAYAPDPEPVPAQQQPFEPAATQQQFEPAARAVTTETAAEAAESGTNTGEPEAELTNWLQFVGGDDRRAERARRRRIQLISLATVIVLLAVGGGLWFVLKGGGGTKATQTTVLLQVKDSNGNAVGNVVLVADKNEVAGKSDPSGRGAALLIPSELSVESAALDSQPFGGAMPSSAPAGKDALTTLLGVDVDGVWSMDELTFAALLNNLIGVSVNVDPASAAAVVDPQTGKPLFQAGTQDLTGDKAAFYAVDRPKGEPPSAQLARFGQVVQGMLAKIPHTASTTAAVLNSLAAVPDPALPNAKLASILTALGAEEQGNRFAEQSLPVQADGSGVMDLDKASTVVANLLNGASKAKDNGGLTRVSVADGTGRSDTVSSRAMAESKLVGGGYTPLDQGVTQQTPNTYVIVPNQGAMSLGHQVALALGLPDSAVRVTPFDTTLTDARVVLGADWTQIGQVPADQPTGAPGSTASGPGNTSGPGTDGGTGTGSGTASGSAPSGG
ncbi:LCP family protein [Catenulispora pinistramenti]|uniref:LCP family protein n=1 Tax=Catenulispora pinistramenti TaxID=2705254 RepID=UPI001BABB255|nr:LCP family protein [Catenulispora pinistramenti]